MSFGLQVDKNVLDGLAGDIPLQLRIQLDRALKLQAWLAGTPDTTLTAAPFSRTAQEVAELKSAYVDLAKLANLAHGQATQAAAYDFFTFAGKLTGAQ